MKQLLESFELIDIFAPPPMTLVFVIKKKYIKKKHLEKI